MATTQKDNANPSADLGKELQQQIEKTMPVRLERYGFSPKDYPKLPNLTVDRPITLTSLKKGAFGSENARQIRVRDFAHLKEIFGTPYEVCSKIGMLKEHALDAEKLIVEIKKSQSSREGHLEGGKFRRLAQIYLYQDDGSLAKEAVPLLEAWRILKGIIFWPWWDIVVNSGQTLTVAPDVHVLWANRVIMHPGSRIVAQGALRIDAYRMESY